MRLVLVRHGRPDEGNVERPHDPPLRADGRRQAQAVAELLAGEGITRIVSSPLLRAHQTAEPLAERLRLPIETLDGWAEADRNLDRYRSRETLRGLGDTEWQRFLDDPVRYLGGDPQRFRIDVVNALHALVAGARHDARIAVYTHGLPINVVLSHILKLDGIVHFHPGYGSITRLRALDAEHIGIVSINERGHHHVARPSNLNPSSP
jgi:broad specificity phosphatase PhoE